MGTKLTGGDFVPTPVANVREAGKFFVGTMLSGRKEVNGKRGKKIVYELAVKDTDMSIQVRDEADTFVEAKVKPGDKVAIFAPTVLDQALQKAPVGTLVRIDSKGMLQGKNSEYFGFDVEAL